MAKDKTQPYERIRIERFTIPFECSGIVKNVCVDYQATECLEDNKFVLNTERCRVSSTVPNMHFWTLSYFGDKRTLRHEHDSPITPINQECLATLRDKLPDYVCNLLPELG